MINIKLPIKKLAREPQDSSVSVFSYFRAWLCGTITWGVDKGQMCAARHGCLRGVTLILVVALIFTGLNKGAGLHIYTQTLYRPRASFPEYPPRVT